MEKLQRYFSPVVSRPCHFLSDRDGMSHLMVLHEFTGNSRESAAHAEARAGNNESLK